jgi:O-antigen/teichoic acid export membrane protein
LKNSPPGDAAPAAGAPATAAGDQARLLQRSIAAIKWNYLGTAGRIATQLVCQIALARLLGPEVNGLFGYAVVIIGLVTLVIDWGLSSALVQTASLSEADLAAAAARLALMGLLATAGVALGAHWLATFLFEAPAAAPVIQATAPTFLITCLGAPAGAVLRRELRFKRLQAFQLMSYVVGYLLVGVGMALAGLGVWSLVGAWLAQCSVISAAQLLSVRGGLRLGNPLRRLDFTNFGLITLLTNLANWALDTATPALIGRIFGATALGLFNMASTLVRTPAGHLVFSLQAVLFPASARMQDSPVALRRSYLVALAAVAIVAVPLFSFVAILADTVTLAVLGPRWIGVAGLLVPLAIGSLFHAIMAIAGPILSGSGRPGVELRVQAATAAALLLAVFVASRISLVAVAWAVGALYIVRSAWMTWAIARRLELPLAAVGAALRGPLLVGLAACLPALILDRAIASLALPMRPLPALGCEALLAALGALVLSLGFPALALDANLCWLLRKLGVSARLPGTGIFRRLSAYLAGPPPA